MSLELGNIVRIFHFDDGNQDLLETNHPNLWKIVEFRCNKSKSIIPPVEWSKKRPFASQVNMKSRSISSWKLQKVDGKLPE